MDEPFQAIVVNVKVKYIRPTYNDLKEWMKDPKNVYIGRRGIVFIDGKRFPDTASIFANPYKVGTQNKKPVDLYREYLIQQIEKGVITIKNLESLRNKNLGCWCVVPGENIDCHGHVLIEVAKKYLD